MWLRGAFPVNHSALQERKKAKTTRATSGRKLLQSCAMYDLNTHSWKTSQVCLLLTEEDTSRKFSQTWPKAGSMQGGTVYPLPPAVPHTGGTGYGSLPSHSIPTPTASDHIERRSTSTEVLNPNTNKSVSLDRFVRYWPTPTASQARSQGLIKQMRKKVEAGEITVEEAEAMIGGSLTPARMQMWPTPRVSDTEGGIVKNVEMKDGTFSRVNKQGVRWGVKLKDAVDHAEKMWPTPTVDGNYNRKGLSKTSGDGLATAVKMWPTPDTQNHRDGSKMRKDNNLDQGGRHGVSLHHAVYHTEKMWPTPTKSDHKGSGPTMVRKDGKLRGDRLDYATERNSDGSPTGGQLNPTWVEWLMGWPLGWTDLKPLEMARFREWLQQHGEF